MKTKLVTVRNFFYAAALLVIIIIISLAIKGTVHSMSSGSHGQILNGYYDEAEDEYRQSVKEILAGNGCGNAGVMLSVVVDADGIRRYSLLINHRKLSGENDSSVAKKEELQSEIEKLKPPTDNCEINVSFEG